MTDEGRDAPDKASREGSWCRLIRPARGRSRTCRPSKQTLGLEPSAPSSEGNDERGTRVHSRAREGTRT
jgi:hypothetical protein